MSRVDAQPSIQGYVKNKWGKPTLKIGKPKIESVNCSLNNLLV